MRALLQLAERGDPEAATAAAALATDLARSPDPADRRAAASALGARGMVAPAALLLGLLDDATDGPSAALDAVMPEDAEQPEVVRRVVAALGEPRTAGSAAAASGGSATRPSLSSPPSSPAGERRGARL